MSSRSTHTHIHTHTHTYTHKHTHTNTQTHIHTNTRLTAVVAASKIPAYMTSEREWRETSSHLSYWPLICDVSLQPYISEPNSLPVINYLRTRFVFIFWCRSAPAAHQWQLMRVFWVFKSWLKEFFHSGLLKVNEQNKITKTNEEQKDLKKWIITKPSFCWLYNSFYKTKKVMYFET